MKKHLFLLFTLILSGCQSDIEEKKLIEENSTSHVFNVSSQELRSKLINSFDLLLFDKGLRLYHKEGNQSPLDTVEIFNQPGNADDFYLKTRDGVKLKSYIYTRNGQPLDYSVAFHLRVTPLPMNNTEVSINTIKPKVTIGKEFFPSGSHFTRQPKYQSVHPSTIEEHDILLTIGKILGDSTLKPTTYPE